MTSTIGMLKNHPKAGTKRCDAEMKYSDYHEQNKVDAGEESGNGIGEQCKINVTFLEDAICTLITNTRLILLSARLSQRSASWRQGSQRCSKMGKGVPEHHSTTRPSRLHIDHAGCTAVSGTLIQSIYLLVRSIGSKMAIPIRCAMAILCCLFMTPHPRGSVKSAET